MSRSLMIATTIAIGVGAGLQLAASRDGGCGHRVIRETQLGILHECATQGSIDAQIRYGVLLTTRGKEREAQAWFNQAVRVAPVRATMRIAQAFDAENRAEVAERWYARAFDLGGRPPALELGLARHRAGDTAEADRWFEREFALGGGSAAISIGFSLARLEDGSAQAATWYKRAADLGHPAGMRSLAEALSTGAGLPQDEREAFRWYRRVALHPQADGYDLLTLADAYDQGRGVPQNPKAALAALQVAKRKRFDDSDSMARDRIKAMEARLRDELSRRAGSRTVSLALSLASG